MSLKDKKLFLLDMDGTIYEGARLFECVNEFLAHIESVGGQYVFITNNSSRSVKDYVIKLSNMGIKVTEDNFFTSSQATALYLNKHFPNKKIYCMGTKSMIAFRPFSCVLFISSSNSFILSEGLSARYALTS